jgi:cardiolipin synthase
MEPLSETTVVTLWAGLTVIVSVVASSHVVINKRNASSAIGWLGVIWLAPFLGTALYVLIGINRIERGGRRLRPTGSPASDSGESVSLGDARLAPPDTNDLAPLGRAISGLALTTGNAVEPLVNGDEAYPRMLAAMDSAQRTITMSTYIFDRDRVGKRFVAALADAVERGVDVRVLIDSLGARYNWPTVLGMLRARGIRTATFLPTFRPWWIRYSNLRNHRKILVVDGRTAFTGGMNIRAGGELAVPSRHNMQDLHFDLQGPIVAQLQDVFIEDWRFATGEGLTGDRWSSPRSRAGSVTARCITDGPDLELGRIRNLLHGAIGAARESVVVMTPYFLPDDALVTALNVAALRGVSVDILIPARGNLRLVQWATMAQLWRVLEHGCRVWLTPPPFDHSKLMVVDGAWSMIGSANWDPRSLRLNFEVNVELYSTELAARLTAIAAGRRATARRITLADVDGRSLLVKLRDGVARLFTPYL